MSPESPVHPKVTTLRLVGLQCASLLFSFQAEPNPNPAIKVFADDPSFQDWLQKGYLFSIMCICFIRALDS